MRLLSQLLPRAFASLILLGGLAHAQLTTVTAPAGSLTIAGVPIAAGTAAFTVVNGLGTPVPTQSGSVIYSPVAFVCSIVSGAITGTCSVPDLNVATPLTPNTTMAYSVTISRTSDGKTYTLQAVTGVSGSTWALNTYVPTQVSVVSYSGLVTGSSVPTSCHGASTFYTQTNPVAAYACVGNVYVLETSGGGSGTSLNYRNAFSSGTTYGMGDAVVSSGSSYLSLQANNTGNAPASSPTYWGLLAAAGSPGATGAAGTNGSNGAAGPTGPAPTLSVGTVTGLASGAQPTANISGSNGAYTLSLGIPAGAAGSSGSGSGNVVTTVAASGATQSITFPSDGSTAVYDITLSANCTFSFTPSGSAGKMSRVTLIIRPNGFQANFPASSSSIVWPEGNPPAPSTTALSVVTLASTGVAPILGGI